MDSADQHAALLAAARVVLELELDAEGCSADHEQTCDALALLRAAVQAIDLPVAAPLLTHRNLRPGPGFPR